MTVPEFPIIELIDRYAICVVKHKRASRLNTDEYNFYKNQISKFNLSLIDIHLQKLIKIHDEIWDLEAELKAGKEHLLSMEEIGQRAINIRDKNNQRVALKNTIAEILGCKIREVKVDHLSE